MPEDTAEARPDERDPQEEKARHPRPTTLLLVRHAVTHQTGPVLSGRTPGIDLSEKGREQAVAAADRLAGLPITAVYASPIERTTQTAEEIASRHRLDVRPLPDMIEADYGEWTGHKLEDLAKTDLWKVVQVSPSRARFPGGESITEMQHRAVAALDALVAAHAEEMVVVVSHSDVIKAAVAHFSGVHLDLFQRIWISPASCTVLQFGPFGAALVKLNDTPTLDELLPPQEKPAEPGAGAAEAAAAEATAAADSVSDEAAVAEAAGQHA
jgi:probable phosphoglycerate mutase